MFALARPVFAGVPLVATAATDVIDVPPSVNTPPAVATRIWLVVTPAGTTSVRNC